MSLFSVFFIFCLCAQICFCDINDAGGDASTTSESDQLFNGFSPGFLQSMFTQNSQQRNYYSNYNNGYSNNYQYANRASPPPIYGNAQDTNGQVNGVSTIRTGQTLNYNSYSNNYWNCVNNYRGQYYYSYNYGIYVCDTRANRSGKR